VTSLKETRDTILGLTSRPDRVDATNIAINQILRKLVGTSRFPQSLLENSYDPSEYLAAGSTTILSVPLPERFNAVSYVKLKDECPLESKWPNQAEGRTMDKGYYVSGPNLLINSGWDGSSSTSLLIGWYQYPAKLVLDTDTNWALDRFEHLVIDLGASYTLTAIGDTASAQALLSFAGAFQPQEIASATTPYEDT